MRTFLCGLAALTFFAVGCSQPSQPTPPQQVTVQCPADSTCDVNVTPPLMTTQEIQYHATQRDFTASFTEEMLMAMMMQDMAWRQCYGCYTSYYDRYPVMRSRVSYVQNQPSNVRAQYVQNTYTTVVQKNITVIQQKASADPPTVKAQPVKNTANTSSGQAAGTGGGSAATNKAPATNSNPAPAQPAKPAQAPVQSQPSKPAAPPAAPPPSAPKSSAPSAPSGKR